jgi:hypothetical protein
MTIPSAPTNPLLVPNCVPEPLKTWISTTLGAACLNRSSVVNLEGRTGPGFRSLAGDAAGGAVCWFWFALKIVDFGFNNKNVNTPITTIPATSPDMSRICELFFFSAMGGGTVAAAGAAEAPELELTGASVANGLPQYWQNVESSGRVAPQKRQNTSGIWDFQALRYRKNS